jgi:hypothetical protein
VPHNAYNIYEVCGLGNFLTEFFDEVLWLRNYGNGRDGNNGDGLQQPRVTPFFTIGTNFSLLTGTLFSLRLRSPIA